MLRIIVLVAFIYSTQGMFFSKAKPSNDISNACKPVDCHGRIKNCQYGFQKKDGCEICKCNDPCNPPGKAILCGTNKRCYVDKSIDGSFVGRCRDGKHKRKRSSKRICGQKRMVGTCQMALIRYYYNPSTSRCESFAYSGCKGNENNFPSKSQCEATCKA